MSDRIVDYLFAESAWACEQSLMLLPYPTGNPEGRDRPSYSSFYESGLMGSNLDWWGQAFDSAILQRGWIFGDALSWFCVAFALGKTDPRNLGSLPPAELRESIQYRQGLK